MPYDSEPFLIEIILKLQELGVPFISISAPSIVSGMSGESEKTLREAFEEAQVRFPLKRPPRRMTAHMQDVEKRPLYTIHRRDRCDHTKAGERATRNGA